MERLCGGLWVEGEEEDPLARFGAVDGVLPGSDARSSHIIRCALIRYESQHCDHIWNSFSEGVISILSVPIQRQSLFTFVPPKGEEDRPRLYCLSPLYLQTVAHLTLAANQIVFALAEFFQVPARRTFLVDPGYKLVELLGGHDDPQEVLMTLAAILRRLQTADQYIRSRFDALTSVLLGAIDFNDLVSQRSTRSSIRSQFGQESPRMELAKLALRPDYQAQ
ncbi:hypothetical protein FB107DRAFT_207228, partial [Schizophyllum commune]